VRRGLRDDRVLTEGAPPRLAGPLERWLRPLLTAGVVEIVGLQLSLPLGSMYNPADALIQRCLMDQDLFLGRLIGALDRDTARWRRPRRGPARS